MSKNKDKRKNYRGGTNLGMYGGYGGGTTYLSNRRKFPVRSKFDRPYGEQFTVSMQSSQFPTVIISHKAHSKMWSLVQECDIEISWLSSVTVTDDGDYVIDDVYVPKQTCGHATTEISSDGEAEMIMEMMNSGQTSEINKLRCWGHSHVNMHVSSSGTDETQTQSFIDRFNDFFVRFIGNKDGELSCHVYMIDKGVVLNEPDIKVLKSDEEFEDDYTDWAIDQIEEKVTEQVYTYNHARGGQFGDIGGDAYPYEDYYGGYGWSGVDGYDYYDDRDVGTKKE